MDAYHPKRRITLSFAGWKGREYVAAAFGGDASLRQRLMQEPGAVANGSAVYLPADGFVLADFFNHLTLLSKSFTKNLLNTMSYIGHWYGSLNVYRANNSPSYIFKNNIKSPLDDILEKDGL